MIKRVKDPLKELSKKKQKEPTFSADVLSMQPDIHSARPGRVLALGDPKITRLVNQDLQSFGLEVQTFSTAKELKAKATGFEDAVVYCAPLVRSEILSIHKGLRKNSKLRNLAFFAIVPNWVNSFKEREMYKRGIRMIFEWPRERETFSSTFAAALEGEILRVRSDDSDTSLRKAVINRLMSEFGEFNPKLDLSVYNGIVIVRGAVKSVGEQTRLSKFLNRIPGVRGVVDGSVHVSEDRLPGFVSTRANQLLDEIEGIPEKTLMVRVSPDEQTLTIVGTAASLKTLEKAKRKMSLFKGVKLVQSEVEVSPHLHSRDLALAKKAQRVVNKITLGSPNSTEVKVLRGEAFVKGEVFSRIESSQVESAIRKLPGIKAVVNRLEIDQSPIYSVK